MAFTSRRGRVVGIGHGAMTTMFWLWVASCVVLAPAAVFAGITLLSFVAPNLRGWAEDAMPGLLWSAMIGALCAFMARTFGVVNLLGSFVGPSGGYVDQLRGVIESPTARWASVSWLLPVILAIAARTDLLPGDRIVVVSILGAVITVVDGFAMRGLRRAWMENRKQPFFAGMTETQAKIADRRWPEPRHVSFPKPDAIDTAEDGDRYASRATDIARGLGWASVGVLIVSSAFVEQALTQAFTRGGFWGMLAMVSVVVGVAAGIALQQRARGYRRLADALTERAQTLRASAAPQPTWFSALVRRFNVLARP